MTVSWGGLGELWGKDVAFIFIRPQRYTYEFIERENYFTMSFFGGEQKKRFPCAVPNPGAISIRRRKPALRPSLSVRQWQLRKRSLCLSAESWHFKILIRPALSIPQSIPPAMLPRIIIACMSAQSNVSLLRNNRYNDSLAPNTIIIFPC